MRYQIESVQPALRVIDSSFSGTFYSIAREYKRTLNDTRRIIERKTEHIQSKGIADYWNRVLPIIRLKMSKLA